MNIGLSIALPAYTIDPAFVARRAEELGFESIWYAEHPAVPVHSESPFPSTGGAIPWQYSHFTDPYIALARASGVTRTIKLGTGITLVPQRHPLVLAKSVAALDFHSGGRFLFGIGTGWLKEEVELMGGNFRFRWTQTREYIEAMKAMWTEDEAHYHGRFIDFPPLRVFPKPAQKPHPPILIGGMAKDVLQRVVDHADGWLPNRVTPSDIEKAREQLNHRANDAGRDPKGISITIYGQQPERELVASFFDAGADRVVVRQPQHVETEAQMNAQLEQMAETRLPDDASAKDLFAHAFEAMYQHCTLMSSTVTEELTRLFQEYVALHPNGGSPTQAFDADWVSPCQLGVPDEHGVIQWRPCRREQAPDWSGLEQALEVAVHHDVKAFYGSYWSDSIPVQAEAGGATLIQVWNEPDFQRLVENLIGHALQKIRRRLPLTLFVACTDEEEFILSVENHSGAVVLEHSGRAPVREVAPDLSNFLRGIHATNESPDSEDAS